MICFGEQSQCLIIRFYKPNLGVEMLCWSNLISCFIRSGYERNELSNKRIKFVTHMFTRNQSENCRRQNGEGLVFTLTIGGAPAWGWKINLSCSKSISTEKVIFDCLNRSCALCFWTGVILYEIEILCLAQLWSFSPLLRSPKRAGVGTKNFWSSFSGKVG